MNNRIYLDHNASAPLSLTTKKWLVEQEHFYANPSSVHTSGKKVKREVEKVKDFLFQTFSLSRDDFDLFFHSGATEGINTVVKGHAQTQKQMNFAFQKTDHSCVVNMKSCLEHAGHRTSHFSTGDEACEVESNSLVNWTWVNNETGLVNPLKFAAQMKEKYHVKVHVDAVQAVGKLSTWQNLEPSLDAYTFSGHKFGALKGIGFTFMRKDFEFLPILRGGGQQGGMRSGTENTWGIMSLKCALEDVVRDYNFDSQNAGKMWFENKLVELMGSQGEVVGRDFPHRNGNTIYFILHATKAQTSAMALDMAGFDVSNGSACSSGAVLPSRVLMNMGHSEDHAKSAIRLSFSQDFSKDKAEKMWSDFERVISRFL